MDRLGDGMPLERIKQIGLAQVNNKHRMNNKWVELPDCSKFGDATGALTVPEN